MNWLEPQPGQSLLADKADTDTPAHAGQEKVSSSGHRGRGRLGDAEAQTESDDDSFDQIMQTAATRAGENIEEHKDLKELKLKQDSEKDDDEILRLLKEERCVDHDGSESPLCVSSEYEPESPIKTPVHQMAAASEITEIHADMGTMGTANAAGEPGDVQSLEADEKENSTCDAVPPGTHINEWNEHAEAAAEDDETASDESASDPETADEAASDPSTDSDDILLSELRDRVSSRRPASGPAAPAALAAVRSDSGPGPSSGVRRNAAPPSGPRGEGSSSIFDLSTIWIGNWSIVLRKDQAAPRTKFMFSKAVWLMEINQCMSIEHAPEPYPLFNATRIIKPG